MREARKPHTEDWGKLEGLKVTIRKVVGIVTGRSKLANSLAYEHREHVEEEDSVTSIRMTSIRMTSFRSQCASCRHFRPWFRGRTSCEAYPEDIPAEIICNRVDHRQPYVGDHGIRYTTIPSEESVDNGVGASDR